MVKSVKRCAALFCRKPFDKTDVYYRFPSSTVKDSFRLRIWQQRLLASREGKQRVCSRHFSPAQFNLRDGKKSDLPICQLMDDILAIFLYAFYTVQG